AVTKETAAPEALPTPHPSEPQPALANEADEPAETSVAVPEPTPTAPAPLDAAPSAPKKREKKEDEKGPVIVDTKPQQETRPTDTTKIVPAVGEGFRLPPTSMLAPPPEKSSDVDDEQLRANARLLEKVLADYGVQGKVEEIHPGPTVTTYEVTPAAGTKVSKVASLAADLALGLSRKVRIIAPIPGKNRIGFELPNETRSPVCLRELI